MMFTTQLLTFALALVGPSQALERGDWAPPGHEDCKLQSSLPIARLIPG